MTDALDRLKAALSDRYTIERELGRGGMAIVYLAEDRKHQRRVALKVLRPELAASLGAERFLREIRTAAQLTHPNILPLHDSGEADGTLYYTMPYVEGDSLRDRLNREKQLPIEDALQITREVADALGYAHEQGIIHRDIKPENILFQSGHALVADFGIARAVSAAGAETLTETGLAVGTPAYMSPEQGVGESDLDGRSDLYSLGCVLYEMLTGEPPYLGNTPQAIIAKKLSGPTPRVSVVRDKVPPAVEAALDRVLSRNAVDRYATVQAFVEELDRDATPDPRRARRRRAPLAALVGGAAIVVGAVGIWMGIRSASPVLDPGLVVVLPFDAVGLPEDLESFARGVVRLADARLTGEGGPRAVSSNTVLGRWGHAGGDGTSAVSEEDAVRLTSDLGAGSLITGSFVGYGDSVEANATLLDLEHGNRHTAQVRGAGADILQVIDQMFVQLVALDAGMDRRSLASLTTTKPDALQAFLKGQDQFFFGNGADAAAYLSTAIDLDSTFALAGLWASIVSAWTLDGDFEHGLTVARAHRDRLSASDQLILDAFLGGPTASETAVRRLPDRPDAWFVHADHLYHVGRLSGIDDALALADAAFDSVRRLSPAAASSGKVVLHPLEYAAVRRDTSRYREIWEPFRSGADSVPFSWHWRAAAVFGDSVRLAVWRDSMPNLSDRDLKHIAAWARNAEMGFEDALAAKRLLEERGSPLAGQLFSSWEALSQLGRPRAAAARLRPLISPDASSATLRAPIWLAMLSDGDTTLATQAAGYLRRGMDPVSPGGDGNREFWDRCALGLWESVRGNYQGASEMLATMRAASPAAVPEEQIVCVGLLEASLGTAGRHVPLLSELDSILTARNALFPARRSVLNWILARLLEREGRYRHAATVMRREFYGLSNLWQHAAVRHRDVGRFALLAGDTALAIESFERYLRFRYAPETELQAEADDVRTQLAALVAR